MHSSIFLNNLTQIDFAFINKLGKLQGHSINVNGLVEGNLNGEEAVVEDFGTCKKRIKNTIDNGPLAIDHRLVIIEGVSSYQAITVHADGVEFKDLRYIERFYDRSDAFVTIETKHVYLTLPCNAVRVIKGEYCLSLMEDNEHSVETTDHVNDAIEVELRAICSTDSISFSPILDTNMQYFSTEFAKYCLKYDYPKELHSYTATFSYTHGLKHSTSYGCQNIAHGHLSMVQLFGFTDSIQFITNMIAKSLNGMFLATKPASAGPDENATVEYRTQRGYFKLSTDPRNILAFDVETTIENILDHIVKNVDLKDYGVVAIAVSEGLCKGSFKVLV